MIKNYKLSNKYLLVGILVVNIFFLFTILLFILKEFSILPSYLFFLTIPIELLSTKIIFVLFILFLELIAILLFWINLKKSRKNFVEDKSNIDFSLNVDSINNQDNLEKINSELIDSNQKPNGNFLNNNKNDKLSYADTNHSNIIENNENMENELEFSNELLEGINTLNKIEINKPLMSSNQNVFSNDLEKNKTISRELIDDQLFSIYQNIVQSGWVYEKANDRERFGFQQNSIDESNIALSDLNKLINLRLIYKEIIRHPLGSFIIYTAIPNAEKIIIKESINHICKKLHLKLFERKFEFNEWFNLGLIKKIWQFDFEIIEPSIIGSIYVNDSFSLLNQSANYSLITNKKEEIKGLIATSTLKLNKQAIALLITNTKEHYEIIKGFLRNTGWGKVDILYFSDSKFFEKLFKLINKT